MIGTGTRVCGRSKQVRPRRLKHGEPCRAVLNPVYGGRPRRRPLPIRTQSRHPALTRGAWPLQPPARIARDRLEQRDITTNGFADGRTPAFEHVEDGSVIRLVVGTRLRDVELRQPELGQILGASGSKEKRDEKCQHGSSKRKRPQPITA